VIAFVEAAKEAEAKAAGADMVGGEELIDKIAQTSQIDFDVAVAR
jgi:large subunit ribosomal protein L1